MTIGLHREYTVMDNLRFRMDGWSGSLPLDQADIKDLLHIPRKMPADFCTFRMRIANVWVWVIPRTAFGVINYRSRGAGKHRVMCECPKCHAELSAGRLSQHMKVHAEEVK